VDDREIADAGCDHRSANVIEEIRLPSVIGVGEVAQHGDIAKSGLLFVAIIRILLVYLIRDEGHYLPLFSNIPTTPQLNRLVKVVAVLGGIAYKSCIEFIIMVSQPNKMTFKLG